MKQLLLLFLIIPFAVSARREDPRVPKTAPYDGVKSMEATYIFILPKGNDTSITETFLYNEQGYLTNYDYFLEMEKNPTYQASTRYQYRSQDAWTQTTYKNKKLTDSVIVRGSWADWYPFKEGKLLEFHEYRGDSTQEIVINGGDTIYRKKAFLGAPEDPSWDYYNAGKYAGRTVTRSVDSDTTRYLNAAGECLVMIVNYYDSNFKPVKTDYYNYKVKRFDLFYLPYNERLYMTFFLNKSKKGKWSFEITRKYNEKGWLVEENFTDANPGKGHNGHPMVKLYKYELY